MANNKSAKKRIIINERNRFRNRRYKSSVRRLTKVFFSTLENSKISNSPDQKQKLQNTLSSIYSLIDKGTKKKVFHKNTAARKKAILASYFKRI